MYRSERVANKPGGQGWQDPLAKCSITVRLELPHALSPCPSIQSRGKIFSDDLTSIIECRVRRDEHNGEDWFCEQKRVETALVWICDGHIAERELTSFGLTVAPFHFELAGGHTGVTST